ncbi:NADP-dependent oxidoreductase [Mycobacterium sp.]|uniref:NADP-dependent oxidoreductase n=1 Tax=Mycobacterium sp. TaxID=1785 RepID=UPI00333EA308|nr:Alcohol dehydrogenase GroES domain protein [Mycobacterium sp.]
MKAVGVTGPDFMPRLFDIDEPVAAPDGVVVEVMATSVNDFDRAAVEGRYIGLTGQLDPVLLGRDFVGRVAAVGDDVDYVEVGMYVAGTLAPGRSGTFTEMVAVPADSLAPVPDGVDLAQAAGVGLAGVSALDAVGALGATRLGTMVIHGPVSGVGGFALQLAKAHGAVVAAVTLPEEADLARKLGADVVIPQGANATQSIQAVRDFFGGGVDTAIHVAGDLSVAAGVVRPGGKFTSVTDTATRAIPSDAEYIPTIVAPSGHKLADLLFKVAADRLHSHVGRTVSFDQVGDAVNAGSNNAGGRTVLVR